MASAVELKIKERQENAKDFVNSILKHQTGAGSVEMTNRNVKSQATSSSRRKTKEPVDDAGYETDPANPYLN